MYSQHFKCKHTETENEEVRHTHPHRFCPAAGVSLYACQLEPSRHSLVDEVTSPLLIFDPTSCP